MIIVRVFDKNYARLARLVRPHLVEWGSGIIDDILDVEIEPSPDLFIRRWPIIAALVQRFSVLALDVDVFPRHRAPRFGIAPMFAFAGDTFGLCAGAAFFRRGFPMIEMMVSHLPVKLEHRLSEQEAIANWASGFPFLEQFPFRFASPTDSETAQANAHLFHVWANNRRIEDVEAEAERIKVI